MKRLPSIYFPQFRNFLFLVLVACFLTSCGKGRRTKLEHARIETILLQSRAYATDHKDIYPTSLDDLYPKYIDLATIFYSPPQSEAEEVPQAYYFRTGLKVGAKMDEPLVVSPHVVRGKVNVGYIGGFIRKLEYEEAQKILTLNGWLQEAPSFKDL